VRDFSLIFFSKTSYGARSDDSVFEALFWAAIRPRSRLVWEASCPVSTAGPDSMRSGASKFRQTTGSFPRSVPPPRRCCVCSGQFSDAVVTINPGTDALGAGYSSIIARTYLYARRYPRRLKFCAWQPWTPSLVMGVDKDRGVHLPPETCRLILRGRRPYEETSRTSVDHERDQGRKGWLWC